MSAEPQAEPDAEQAVPRLPRGRGLKLSRVELVRIGLTLTMLVGVIAMTRPCADAVSGFVTGFDGRRDASRALPRPGTVDTPATDSLGANGTYEPLRPDMTEAELRAAIERSRARAVAGAASPGVGSSAGAGAASPGVGPSAGAGAASPGVGPSAGPGAASPGVGPSAGAGAASPGVGPSAGAGAASPGVVP